jgi:hypothetical protein
MSIAEVFGCYLGWILLLGTLISIYIWRRITRKTGEWARLRKQMEGRITTPWPRWPR